MITPASYCAKSACQPRVRLLGAVLLTIASSTATSAQTLPMSTAAPELTGVLMASNLGDIVAPFEDLLPKFQSLSMGQTMAEVVTIMGKPSAIEANEYVGIAIHLITWTNLRGQRFSARFVHGRLASKSFSV